MADPPFCGRCNRNHWRFKKCDEVKSAPFASHLSVPEGHKPWEDNLITLDKQGFTPRKHPASHGDLHYPKGYEPPDAA